MTTRFLAPRPDRGRLEVRGAQATAVLNGLLTNDASVLADGAGQWAAALTAKGRVLALIRLLRDGDRFLLDTDAAALPGLLAMLRKYVNPRLATVTDLTTSTRTKTSTRTRTSTRMRPPPPSQRMPVMTSRHMTTMPTTSTGTRATIPICGCRRLP